MTACLGAALFCLAYPIYVIRPFRPQGVRELAVALNVLQIRGIATAICSSAALIVLVWYWRAQPRLRQKIFAGVTVLCVFLCTALSRVNVYERMFHPLGTPTFSAAKETKLDGDEKVLAVRIHESARAYPIRSIAYHHIVNDTLAGVPLAATY